MRKSIQTENAPAAIGPYSQAVQVGNTVFLSGQIPLDAITKELVSHDITQQVTKVFENLAAVVTAAGGSLNAIVRVGVYLTDLSHFPIVNAAMEKYFTAPFPARSTIEVSKLPKNALVEVDAIMVLENI